MVRTPVIFLFLGLFCSCANVLTYKHKKRYTENSIITSGPVFKLFQRVLYNEPGVIDEEFSYDLTLTFLDTAAAKKKRMLDLETDTLIVKARYGIFSVWNWGDERNTLTGEFEIIKWNSNEVVLKENIVAHDYRRKEIKKFKGTRTFKRKEGW